MAEFTVNDKQYRSGRLDAFKQFHITRRLAPLAGAYAKIATSLRGNPREAFSELAGAIAGMKDEDVEYVQRACLALVQRRQGELWANVLPSGGALAFDDIQMLDMNEIVFNVLKDNLSDFFSGIARRGWAVPV